uniref:Large ribosomal subunit protein mL52 n=1 Tax=Salvator merianae TaxID=96440 RepID=A0A8D0B5H6_SALMN
MAACGIWRLGSQLAKTAATSRNFHCSPRDWAGAAWRIKHGFPVNPSIYGPTTDLPDWSFADGRPAPPLKGQTRRREKNEVFARRVAMISAEMDHALEKWEAKQKANEEAAEKKLHKKLKPKGHLLLQKDYDCSARSQRKAVISCPHRSFPSDLGRRKGKLIAKQNTKAGREDPVTKVLDKELP